MTVGLYRDIRKWVRRDKRSAEAKKSAVNFKWLNPFTVAEILKGKELLESLRKGMTNEDMCCEFNNFTISNKSVVKGIELYDMALRLYMGSVIDTIAPAESDDEPSTSAKRSLELANGATCQACFCHCLRRNGWPTTYATATWKAFMTLRIGSTHATSSTRHGSRHGLRR